MMVYALVFFLVGLACGFVLKKAIHRWELSKVINWAAEQIGNRKEITYVDDWDPERHELRQFRVLKHVDEAESGEEYFREVPGGMARFVKLDRRRRAHHGFAEIDVMNAYDLSDGENAEEEPMEIDEEETNLPPVAALSAAMAEADQHGHAGQSAGSQDHVSDSNTREYVDLPGSPESDHVPPTLLWWAWTGMTTRRSCGTILASSVREPYVYSK